MKKFWKIFGESSQNWTILGVISMHLSFFLRQGTEWNIFRGIPDIPDM